MTSTPFMQLYIADYLGDTLHLTTEQHGAYLLILMAMWRADGRLPNDPSKLARIARVSARRWHLLADDVMAFFDADGGEITHRNIDRRGFAVPGRPNLNPSVRKQVYERDGYACSYCSGTTGPFQIDHIYPVSRGGGNDLENLTVACETCNRAKGALLLSEWGVQ